MASHDLVTVVIPDYNHARYVGDAIESVLAQTYQHVEILVVDDGSTDDSEEVVARFGTRVRYVKQENKGLSAARNTGIELARGEFIAVLDADDMYEPQFVSRLVGVLSADPEAEAAFCGYRFVDAGNVPLPQVEARRLRSEQVFVALVDGNFLVPEAWLVRRRCYMNVGPFDVSLTALEDLDMWLRISSGHRVVGVPDVLTRHRVLPGSMSTDPARQHRNRLKVIGKQFGPESEPGEMTERQRRAYGRAYLAAVVEHLQSGRTDSAMELFRRMVQFTPGLLIQGDALYELICGAQPKGFRGDFKTVDVTRGADVLMRFLDAALMPPAFPPQPGARRGRIFAQAHLTAALLHYGKRELRDARASLYRSVAADPRMIASRAVLTCLLKSALGAALIDRLRWFRHVATGSGHDGRSVAL
jgi:hypothetical protein